VKLAGYVIGVYCAMSITHLCHIHTDMITYGDIWCALKNWKSSLVHSADLCRVRVSRQARIQL